MIGEVIILNRTLTEPSLLKTNNFIDGEWIASSDSKKFSVYNPANNKVIVEVAYGGGGEAHAAICAAEAALAP